MQVYTRLSALRGLESITEPPGGSGVAMSPENSPFSINIVYRLDEYKKALEDLGTWRREVDRDRTTFIGEMSTVTKNQEILAETVNTLRKTLLGFAFTIAGSAVVFALTVLIATGKI